MTADFADRVTQHPPVSLLRRMIGCMWQQTEKSGVCPDTPRIDGQIALVTGGSRGIGLETSRGLAVRGAEVISAARGEETGKQATEALRAEFDRPAHFVALDLSDLRTLSNTVDRLEEQLAGRQLDILIANAGLWPQRYAVSAQGHEIAFATNVLGHHALFRELRERSLLAEGTRVVIVTGDIYILTRECSADYAYRGALGGQLAYCRSKLGNLWYAREIARRYPECRVHAVHPGVIATELGTSASKIANAVKRRLMLSVAAGAQTSLFCATQPGLESGTYYHNTMGRVELSPQDPAADTSKANALWELVERLARATPAAMPEATS
jgi:NAD(P)-dependent dehydrogenase (short-subunit alcohol dehydrogenase family)